MAKATVFIGDLSRFCSDEDISSLFLRFGKVLETKIIRNPVTGISLGYGFLIMGSTESASLAMQYLQGVQLRGRPLRVKWAGRNIKNDLNPTSTPRHSRDSTTETIINSVHVRFQALHISSCLFTEESLYQFFMPFGEVTDASIKESNVDEATGLQHGYGFVHFNSTPDGANSAFRAIMELTGDVFFSLHCEGSRNFMKQFHGNHATQIATQISRTKSAPTSLPRNTNTTYRNAPGSSKSGTKSNASYSDFNFKNGPPCFNQSMGSLTSPENMIYPPVPYINSMGNIVPNSAYFYTSAGPYGPMPLSSPSVLLPPTAFSSQSNMRSFPLYDAYSPGYPFFPVSNQMPSNTQLGPSLENYHGNYSSDPVPRAPGVPATGLGRGRSSLLNRSNNKSRTVLLRSKNIIHGGDNDCINDSLASSHLHDLQASSFKLAVV